MISISPPTAGRPNAAQSFPPRRQSSIQRTIPPSTDFHPLLPGANANCPGSTAKLPSLAIASYAMSPLRKRMHAPERTLAAPSLIVVFRLP